MVKKIAFDLHGVLDEHPVELKPMIRMLEEINMEIHIVSGPTVKEIVKTLCDLHYQDYKRLYPQEKTEGSLSFPKL